MPGLSAERRQKMKKVAFLSIVLILMVVLAVPAMAKTPNHGNENGGNAGKPSSTQTSSVDQNGGNQASHQNQNNQGNRGNHGARGNGNQGRTHPNTPFYLQGTIETITGTDTITVTLTHGNAMVKQFIGDKLTIKVTNTTQIYKIVQGSDDESGEGESETPEINSAETETNGEGEGNRVAILFSDLKAGQYVAIHGNLVDGVYTARLITVYLPMAAGESVGEQP
jgi:hypothetical protein